MKKDENQLPVEEVPSVEGIPSGVPVVLGGLLEAVVDGQGKVAESDPVLESLRRSKEEVVVPCSPFCDADTRVRNKGGCYPFVMILIGFKK